MSKKSFKDQVGDMLEKEFPGQVQRDVVVSASGEIPSAAGKPSSDDPDLAKIQELEESCRELELVYLDAKQAAKAAKESFDAAVSELRDYIRSLKGEEMPLYQAGANGEAEEAQP